MDPLLAQKVDGVLPCCQGWCSNAKALTLAGYIVDENVSLAVELGIFGGKSLLPMAVAMKHKGSGEVWGVDPFTKDAVLEGEHSEDDRRWWAEVDLDAIYHGFVGTVFHFQLARECKWMRTSSDKAAGFFQSIGPIDLWHCDSNHSELVSCREVEIWTPLVKQGGILITDDISWPTMRKAIGMVETRCELIEKSEGQWAAWRKK